MKDFSAVQTQIRENTSVSEQALARVEWNLNRYLSPTVTNPDASAAVNAAWEAWGAGDTLFPLKSLTDVNKYKKGIAYIINDPGAASFNKIYDYARMPEATRQSLGARFYYADKSNSYKYWASPVISSSTLGGGTYALASTGPVVDYGVTVQANKISLKFNTHIARPNQYTVEISTNGSSWTTVATDPVVSAATGVVDLYAPTGAGAWTTTPVYYTVDGVTNNLKSFRYIRVRVTGLTRGRSRLEFLEIAAKIHVETTAYLKEYDITEELSEGSDFAPVGTITSNQGNITLANYNGFFSKKAGMSPVSAYLDEFAIITLFTKYGSTEVPLGPPMFSDKWNFKEGGDGSVSMVDFTRIMQETPAPDMFVRNARATTVIWMLMDQLGYPDVKILESSPGECPIIEAFYCRKEDKVWDVVKKLAKDFQLSIHMANDGLRVMTKEYIYNTRATTWTVRETASGNEKPDLMDYSTSSMQASNKVTLDYSAVNYYNLSGGKTQIFWQAPETFTIGATELTRDLLTTEDYAYMRADKPEQMPRNKGRFKVDSEWLTYTHKEYRLANGTLKLVSDESEYFAAIEANNGKPPVFTGRLKLKTRATVDHRSGNWKLNNVYRIRRAFDNNPSATVHYPQGVKLNSHGQLIMSNPYSGFGSNPRSCRVMALRNWGGAFNRMGMKFKITSGAHGTVGLVLYPQGSYDHKGYAFSVTVITDPSMKGTKNMIGEVKGVRYEGDGSPTSLTVASPSATSQYEATKYWEKHHAIVKRNTWHWMEVVRTADYKGRAAFAVYVDGRCVKVFMEPGGTYMSPNYWAGPYVTAGTSVEIEKLFVIDYPSGKELKRLPDGIKTWYPDNQWLMAYDQDMAPQLKMSQVDWRYHVYLSAFYGYPKIKLHIDEFGGFGYPVIREILEEDFRYKVFPAITSKLYLSNKNVAILKWSPGAMGGKALLINAVNSLQFLAKEPGSYSDIPKSGNKDAFYAWGRALFRMDPQKIEKKNEDAIRQRGEQEISFETEWIQTRAIAENMAEWIYNNLSASRDRYELKIFGNPLLEVGDSINIVHSEINAGTFVISKVSHNWDNGLWTDITVVRTS